MSKETAFTGEEMLREATAGRSTSLGGSRMTCNLYVVIS